MSGLPPMLVVSITGDPATPYEAGVELARPARGAGALEGNQHPIALQGNDCIENVVAYLIDLRTPGDSPRCTL